MALPLPSITPGRMRTVRTTTNVRIHQIWAELCRIAEHSRLRRTHRSTNTSSTHADHPTRADGSHASRVASSIELRTASVWLDGVEYRKPVAQGFRTVQQWHVHDQWKRLGHRRL